MNTRAAPLPRAFYERPTAVVARELVGKVLVRRPEEGGPVRRARIVEVEAYLGVRDLASHARNGPTPRSAIMFGPPGRLYVYLIYGLYHCMNLVTERDGTAGAVLVRAAEPLPWGEGDGFDAGALRGPGKLCRGLGVTLAHKGLDLTAALGPLVVMDDGQVPASVGRSARIGVEYAGAWAARPLRFFVPAHPSVSGPRRLSARAGSTPHARSTRTSPGSTPTPGRR